MQTPFEILGIPEDSDDRIIKKAYLDKVRAYPPERFPREFQKIRRAYELVRDEKARIRTRLFHMEKPQPEDIAGLIFKKHTAAILDVLRVINRYPLDPEEKSMVLSHVGKINGIVQPYSREDIADADSRRKIGEQPGKCPPSYKMNPE